MSVWKEIRDKSVGTSVRKEELPPLVIKSPEEEEHKSNQIAAGKVKNILVSLSFLLVSNIIGLTLMAFHILTPVATFIAFVPFLFILLVNLYIDEYGDDGFDNYM